MSSSYTTTATRNGRGQTWQQRLTDMCVSNKFSDPIYNIISDRRGGRTAWSSTVTIANSGPQNQHTWQARFWYDGAYIDNAREDAAEVAVQYLASISSLASTTSSSSNGAPAYAI